MPVLMTPARSRLPNPRNLAAIDIAFLGPKFVIAEFVVGVSLPVVLGLFTLRNHSFWQVVIGLYLICLGINYLPMLIYAIAIRTKEKARAQIADELTDKRAAMRKYRRQSLILLLPLSVPILAIIQRNPKGRMLERQAAKASNFSGSHPQRSFPPWIQWAAAVWLVVWVPAYWHAWGLANFLHLCDLAVFITCAGLWTNSSLLLSSQAVGSLLVDLAWTLDATWKLVAHHHLIGGTEYLFDQHIALWIRLLSLFHVALPPLLLWALSRTGYDRRAWALQSTIAVAAFTASRFTSPATNINFAFIDPFWHRSVGPPVVHVAASILFMAIVVYLPTHLVLERIYRQARIDTSQPTQP